VSSNLYIKSLTEESISFFFSASVRLIASIIELAHIAEIKAENFSIYD
jgi:hypothetical protein